MAAQEAENTAYGIIYFLHITAQGRSDESRTKSCSAKASQCRICTESICAISRVSRCVERRIHPYKRESVGRMSCGLRIAVLDVTICNTYEIHCSQRPREV